MHKAQQGPSVFKKYHGMKLPCLAVNQHYMSDSARNHWSSLGPLFGFFFCLTCVRGSQNLFIRLLPHAATLDGGHAF